MGTRLLFEFFEIDALVDRQVLQIPAQAIETHFHRTESYPVAAADNARAAQDSLVRRRDRQADVPSLITCAVVGWHARNFLP